MTLALCILVVDDYADARDVLGWVLEHAGYKVITAADGAEAVSMAQAHQPAVIIMDICMPTMDGVEATRQIKSTQGLAQVPVVAYTARADAPLDKGLFAAVCKKPCAPDVLVNIIASAVSGQLDASSNSMKTNVRGDLPS